MNSLLSRLIRIRFSCFNPIRSNLLLVLSVLLGFYCKSVLAQPEQDWQTSATETAVEQFLAPYFEPQAPFINDKGESVTPKSPFKTRRSQGASTYANAVADLYVAHNSARLWGDAAALQTLAQAIDAVRDDGLNPNDYQQAQIAQLAQRGDLSAEQELMASASLLRVLFHLTRGKVNESGNAPVWNFAWRDLPVALREALTQSTFTAASVAALVDSARPDAPEYQNLKAAYLQLRDQDTGPALPKLTGTITLKPCDKSQEIIQLRARLAASADYQAVDGAQQQARAAECIAARAGALTSAARAAREAQLARWQQAHDAALINGWEFSEPPPEAWNDDDEARVARHNRLQGDGDDIFDAQLVEAVKQFQRANFLQADGVVGPATRRALNISPRDRLEQVRINLDRARWRLQRMRPHMVLVDLAGFRVRYYVDGAVDWESRVQIGMAYRTSPVIDSNVTHITLNPAWTVPPTILRKDILPKLRSNPGYLKQNRLTAYNRDGRVLDPYSVNWSNPGPVTLRQAPSPKGALGVAAIRFPNNHAVYLHDTPHQKLFDKDSRATSSGCIRVERAPELVKRLLANTPEWSEDTIDRTIARGKTQNAKLRETVPILIAYWTVDALSPTQLIFKEDVYRRDEAMLAALNRSD